MKKEITEQEAFLQLAALCAQAEHCQQEMRDKLKRWDIDETTQERIIQRLDDNEYLDVLRPLLRQKRKAIKAQNDYELNQKLVRFAMGRGFTFDIIRQCLDVDEDDFETER